MNTLTEISAREDARPTVAAQLSSTELAALVECEDILRKGHETALQVYVRMGRALKRIRDGRLYRGRYCSFEQYCDGEWNITDHHARNYIRGAEVYLALEEKRFLLLPASESQARPLAKLPVEELGPAWEQVVGTAPNGKVTARHVAMVVQRRLERVQGLKSKGAPSSLRSDAASGPQSAVVDLPDVGTREKRIRTVARETQQKLIELKDAIGTADGTVAANVVASIHDMLQGMDELAGYLSWKEEMLQSRLRKETEIC